MGTSVTLLVFSQIIFAVNLHQGGESPHTITVTKPSTKLLDAIANQICCRFFTH